MNKNLYRIPKYVAWFYPRRIWYGEEGKAYLTFDDGPHPEITPWLLKLLKKQDVKATFFWSGIQMEKHPEFIQQAIDDGHVVGHHGFEHNSGRKLSLDKFKENFQRSKELVTSDLFRPPYGEIKSKQAKYALENGKLVMWSWMSYDYDKKSPAKRIIDVAKEQIREKDILVFHENDKTKDKIKDFIPEIIKIIQDKGLKFDTIDNIN